jgi:hypothetical protein
VAKNDEWQQRQKEDWDYVTSMTRFYHWWIKHQFNIDFSVETDILPVIPGRFFDRMSVGYLTRDHNERGKTVYHFYFADFKPLWTDCQTEGYSTENFCMVQWKRPKRTVSNSERVKFFADNNCANISHLLSHEVIRMKGKKRKEYFDAIHDLWDQHVYKGWPFIDYNERFAKVSKNTSYRFVTLDTNKLSV